MPFTAFYSPLGLLIFFCALLISVLLYWRHIKENLVRIASMCSLLVFLSSLVVLIGFLWNGLDLSDPAQIMLTITFCLLMNLYACVFNVAARVWARVAELMGNKRLKIHIEVVER